MWKRISSKKIFDHPRMGLIEDEVILPNGKQVSYLTMEHRNDSVTVICVDGDKVLLQKEYSYPVDEVLYQFPGGKAESGEDPQQSAQRELQEESGYMAGSLTPLGWYYVNNRRSSSKMYVFLTTNAVACEKAGGDPEEDIVSMWMPIDELEQKIANGEVPNFSVLAAWTLFKKKQT